MNLIKRNHKSRATLAIAVFLTIFTCIARPCQAGNKLINVQGKLTNAAGNPISGTVAVTFRLYANLTDTVIKAAWTESQSITPANGLFNVTLGKVTSLDPVLFNKPYYLGIQVAGDTSELTPRQLLGASAYALGSLGDFNARGNITAMGNITTSAGITATGRISASSITVNNVDVGSSLLPAGTILMFGGTNVPTGFFPCNGAPASVAAWPALFKAIGYTWGTGRTGPGGSEFSIPDLRGRAPVGAGAGSGLTNRAVGQVLGAETHALTVAQMPTHDHPLTDPGHFHDAPTNGFANKAYPVTPFTGDGTGATIRTNTKMTGITIGSSGSGEAHNNMQPSGVVNYIIKY